MNQKNLVPYRLSDKTSAPQVFQFQTKLLLNLNYPDWNIHAD